VFPDTVDSAVDRSLRLRSREDRRFPAGWIYTRQFEIDLGVRWLIPTTERPTGVADEYVPMGGYEFCDGGPGGHGRRHQLLVRHASGNEPV
jgi:hypothetical protein